MKIIVICFHVTMSSSLLIEICKSQPSNYKYACELIDEADCRADHQDYNRETALMQLCKNPSWNYSVDSHIADKLLENCCGVNLQNTKGETALTLACHSLNCEMALKLVDAGANIHLKCVHGVALGILYERSYFIDSKICEKLKIQLLEQTYIPDLEIIDKNGKNVLNYLYMQKVPTVLNHLKFMFRTAVLETIDNKRTVICKSFSNRICDLNIVDIVVNYIY